MKRTRTIIAAILTAIVSSGIVTLSSCTKDPCSGVVCQNGGECTGGSCSCLPGYTGGNCEYLATTGVTYTNDTYTPITINQGGNISTIPVNGSLTYTGSYGTSFTATAATAGSYGQTITWNLSETFPASGNLTEGLDVDNEYFYLLINNSNLSNSYVTVADVNYTTGAQTVDNVSIPDNGTTYGIGYYAAYSSTAVKLTGNAGTIEYVNPLPLTFTLNQSYTFYYN